MPIVNLRRGLDVFGFIDADSPEAKAFTTYLGYWEALARLIEGEYGTAPEAALVEDLLDRQAVRKMQAKRFEGDEVELAKVLLNGWAQEASLYAVDIDDPRLMLHNLWNNVSAYYAMSASARAFLLVRHGSAPRRHSRMLRALAGQVENAHLFPHPWCLACTGVAPLWGGFPNEPGECSNLEGSPEPLAMVAKALKTTRRREVDRHVEQRKQDLRLDSATRGLRAQIDSDLPATTVFDFMWRNRTRSNYGDPSMFYVGSLSEQRSRDYAQAVRRVTATTMLVFETMVAQRAPKLLVSTAVHFMSRDRTQISDLLVGVRLRSLGLLAPPEVDEPF